MTDIYAGGPDEFNEALYDSLKALNETLDSMNKESDKDNKEERSC